MARSSSAPATKKDFASLQKEIQRNFATKKDLKDAQQETIRQFKFIAEQIHKDAIDANKERIELHEDRITRLERYVGLPRSLSA